MKKNKNMQIDFRVFAIMAIIAAVLVVFTNFKKSQKPIAPPAEITPSGASSIEANKPPFAYDINEYVFILSSADKNSYLLRDMNYTGELNGYQLFDKNGKSISTLIRSRAHAGEIYFDPANNGFIFVDMTWTEQFSLAKIEVNFYDLETRRSRVIYTTPDNFSHRGPCYVGALNAVKNKIAFSNSEEENGCFEGDTNYRNKTIYIPL